jgi:tRNA modification GTPase
MSYAVDDTIAAIATARGPSGIGVVRLCGPDALTILAKHFRPSKDPAPHDWPSHTARHGWIVDNALTIDEVLVTYFKAPASYTGDSTVEIAAHGNPVILEELVRLCCAGGARLARPGEFTFRAFANGKMDLAEAEAVADIIAAKTARSAAAAVSQLRGGVSLTIETWRKKVIDLLSAVEVSLDYGDENIKFLQPAEIKSRLAGLSADIDVLLATAAKGMLLRDGLRVCIAGSPNAGKSSLLNALLERDRAIVSEIPGTTRDVIEELLDIQGIPVVITDTAGLREHTVDPLEKHGHERTIRSLVSADIILWLTDASRPLSPEDIYVRDALKNYAAKIIPVGNKIDLPMLEPITPALKISTKTGKGIKELEAAIVSAAGAASHESDEPLITSARHRDALIRAQKALQEAQALFDGPDGTDVDDVLVAEHLRETLTALGEITGQTTPEDILGNIFSHFCVGK